MVVIWNNLLIKCSLSLFLTVWPTSKWGLCLLPSSANMISNYFFSFGVFLVCFHRVGPDLDGTALACLFCMVLRGYSNHMMQKTHTDVCMRGRMCDWVKVHQWKNTPKWSKSRKALYRHRQNKSMLCKGKRLYFIWYWIMNLELLAYVGTAGVVW